ncbi:MAG: HEAT repeat domain-containing protein, partial [Pirellulales bacterium]
MDTLRIPTRRIACWSCLTLTAMLSMLIAPGAATAQEPQWIWAAEQNAGNPVGTVFFRRAFNLKGGQSAKIQIACDDSYTLLVNGARIGAGEDWRTPQEYDLTKHLQEGVNAVCVSAVKREKGPAGMVARLTIVTRDGREYDLSTDQRWRSSVQRFNGWEQATFNDRRWQTAKVLGPIDKTEPWVVKETEPAGEPKQQIAEGSPKFRVMREFRVEWLVKGVDCGSLLAITFNEFGHLLASKEGAGLILIRDVDGDGRFDRVSPYCDEVKNCQGILALNGETYVTGDGPDGPALYRLTDTNHDGRVDEVHALIKFKNTVTEHGAHGIVLGPDGLLYVVLGNHTTVDGDVSDTGPYRNFYEGDLVQPRYQDPTGHGANLKAPGGMVIRTNLDGTKIERVAGGLRNPYDITFNSFGELFTADADMERDHGLPWYRPTRVMALQPGGEYGWRPGWAKWPAYYYDSLPAMIDTGAGSPTGLAFYDHFAFPIRHQNTLFVGDWARGQILQLTPRPDGAGYECDSRVFVEGTPLSVTDLAVGPDGALYFCSGGRGTEGGVYRVKWTGKVPPEVSDLGAGIEQALRQPQLGAAWARQRVAKVKHDLGDQWETELTKLVQDTTRDPKQRLRALDLMQLFGPFPSQPLLVELSQDRDGTLRAKAAYMMGLHPGKETAQRLPEMLADSDPFVQRIACEAHVRRGLKPSLEALSPLLASRDRSLATAARRVLETMPRDAWQEQVLASDNIRLFLQGGAALAALGTDKENCLAVLARSGEWMDTFVADGDFIDLLRLQQLAMMQGGVTAEDVPELAARIAKEFPAGNAEMNRELVRLVAHLDTAGVAQRYIDHLQSDIPLVEKMHLAVHAGRFQNAWNTDQTFALMDFMKETRNHPSGSGYVGYLDKAVRDLVSNMNETERARVIASGADWPEATLWAVAKLPPQPGDETLAHLRSLHAELKNSDDEAAERLRVGIVAVLAREGDEVSMNYLRECFEQEPNHRSVLAMGLAQQPNSDNWPLLIRALPVAEGAAAMEILNKLGQSDVIPTEPEPIRQVILKGLAFNERQRPIAVRVLNHWTEQDFSEPDQSSDELLARWQEWFRATYPAEADPALPQAADTDTYTMAEILEYLDGDE